MAIIKDRAQFLEKYIYGDGFLLLISHLAE
jgi:hypothetical protein